MQHLSGLRFSGHSAIAWLTALGLFLVFFGIFKTTLLLIRKTLRKRFHTNTAWAPFVVRAAGRTSSWFLAILALVAASERLSLSPHVRTILIDTGATAIFIQIAVWGSAFIRAGVEHYKTKAIDGERTTTMVALGFIATLLLWMLLTLVALNNLGVDVTALLAGFGVGGVAFALAVQTTLADILASLSIYV